MAQNNKLNGAPSFPLSLLQALVNLLTCQLITPIIVKQNCFWNIVVRRMQQVAQHTALIRPYSEDEDNFCLFTMYLCFAHPILCFTSVQAPLYCHYKVLVLLLQAACSVSTRWFVAAVQIAFHNTLTTKRRCTTSFPK